MPAVAESNPHRDDWPDKHLHVFEDEFRHLYPCSMTAGATAHLHTVLVSHKVGASRRSALPEPAMRQRAIFGADRRSSIGSRVIGLTALSLSRARLLAR